MGMSCQGPACAGLCYAVGQGSATAMAQALPLTLGSVCLGSAWREQPRPQLREPQPMERGWNGAFSLWVLC